MYPMPVRNPYRGWDRNGSGTIGVYTVDEATRSRLRVVTMGAVAQQRSTWVAWSMLGIFAVEMGIGSTLGVTTETASFSMTRPGNSPCWWGSLRS
jgi:hypothetical protein